VPSAALARWEHDAQRALNEIEVAHRGLRGGARGRRYATLQINHAYAVLLASQFQGFCRDLHSEAVDAIASGTTPGAVARVLLLLMSRGRKLDAGNANPGSIGADFARLGMEFWVDVEAADPRNARRREALEALNLWRNAIAHQDWSRMGGVSRLRLRTVQRLCALFENTRHGNRGFRPLAPA